MPSQDDRPFATDHPELDRLAFFLGQFYKESDRAAPLVAAAICDEVLLAILESFMVDCKESREILRGPNAPLGSFSARIRTSYSLGLIEHREYEELQAIRKIRNEFAHGWQVARFDSTRIERHMSALPFAGYTLRRRFNSSVANLLGDLLWRARLARRERRVSRAWPNKSGFGRE